MENLLKKISNAPTEKELRVLIWSGQEHYLPRNGSPIKLEQDYLSRFAQQQGMKLTLIPLNKFEELIPALLVGKGDLIAANLTITDKRKKKLLFTIPFAETTEYLVAGKKTPLPKSGKLLAQREVVVRKGTSYAETAEALAKTYEGLKVRYLEQDIDSEGMLDAVATGEFDLIIKDQNMLNSALQYRDDIKKGLQASGKRKIAWAIRSGNEKLLEKLNKFLKLENIALQNLGKYKSQWQRIQATKTIRIVMRNNFSSYFIWRGHLLGFNYELAKKFADKNNLRLEIIVAGDHSSMLDYLLLDQADIALGFLTPNQQRIDRGIAFSKPYHYASELLVSRSDEDGIHRVEDLADKTIVARKSSSYWYTLENLQQQVGNINLLEVSENEETETLVEAVGDGVYDLTVADSHIVDLELTFRDDIKSLLALTEPKAQSWAVREDNDELLKAVNQFINKQYKGLFYNVLYSHYFKDPKKLDKHREDYIELRNDGKLSPYDDVIKKYAHQYDFDWRLMTAQMFKESQFNPKAKSFAGAIGLFQVMPRTGRELGMDDLYNPETGIHAGIKYMAWVQDRMEYIKPEEGQLIWFTLAAYNAGPGHVRDAVSLARRKGWNPKIWFGNVEKAMLLLSRHEYASKARYGFVRGREPVNYVSAIKQHYESYKQIVE